MIEKRNNGIIEVIPSADVDPHPWFGFGTAGDIMFNPVTGRIVPETINGKKHLVPERTLRLDFLDKVHKMRGISAVGSMEDGVPGRLGANTAASSVRDEEDEESNRCVSYLLTVGSTEH